MRWAAVCLGMMLCAFAPAMDGKWLLAGLLLSIAVASRWRNARYLVWLCFGFGYALLRFHYALSTHIPADIPSQYLQAEVTVLDVVVGMTANSNSHANPNEQAPSSQRFLAELRLPQQQGTYRVMAQDYRARNWSLGSVWRCPVRLRASIGALNPSGLNGETWALANRVDGFATLGADCQPVGSQYGLLLTINEWRNQLYQRLLRLNTTAQQGVALVAALTIGVQDGLNDDTWLAFRRLGVVHLLSISGVHVTMLAALAAWLMGQLLKILPVTVKTPMLWQVWGGAAVAIAYALLAGFQVPTQRTVWMLLVFALALTWRRPLKVWDAWILALNMVLLLEPTALLSIGLWLSFALVAIIIWVEQVHRQQRHQALKSWQEMLRASWAALLLTLVWVGGYFHSVPIWSPLANAVTVPWFSWVLTPLALLASILPWDAPLVWVIWLAQYTLDVGLWLSGWSHQWLVAQSPWWASVLATVAVVVVLLPNSLALRPWATVVLLVYALYRPPAVTWGQVRMEVIDVGQGLSVLLQTQHHGLLFDTGRGNAGSFVLPALQRRGLGQLDALVLSHNDSDHDGAAASLMRQFKFQTIWTSNPDVYPQWSSQNCREQVWQWDGVWFEWLTLPSNEVANTGNARSCVLRVVTAGQAVLIPADIGSQEEAQLLARYGHQLRSTVLVLGHHGSRSSSSSAWLNSVAPELAIASSGWRNAYQHPTTAVQQRLCAHNIALYRTDTQGYAVWTLDDQLQDITPTGRSYWWQRKPFAAEPACSS